MSAKCACGRSLYSARLYPLHCDCGKKHFCDDMPPAANQSTEPVCVHRGDKIGTADCGCAGKPKVYQCGIHGFAMDRKLKPGKVPVVTNIGKQHFDVAYCNACGDFAGRREDG